MKNVTLVLLSIITFSGCAAGSGDSGDGAGGEGGSTEEGGEGGSSDDAVGGAAGNSNAGSSGQEETGAAGGSSGDAGAGGGGDESGSGGSNAAGGSQAGTGGTKVASGTPCTSFMGTVRDFKSSHPDFYFGALLETMETPAGGRGMVKEQLDKDGKPQLINAGPWKDANGITQVTSQETFAQWFRDVDGVNKSSKSEVKLVERSNGLMHFNPDGFFYPVDNLGFGNLDITDGDVAPTAEIKAADAEHNQLLTFEIHAEFIYQGGELFITESDDDSWIFINGKLAVDNGGLHNFIPATGQLDKIAVKLGLEKGKRYPISMYFADRQMPGAKYRVSTNAKFTHCWQ